MQGSGGLDERRAGGHQVVDDDAVTPRDGGTPGGPDMEGSPHVVAASGRGEAGLVPHSAPLVQRRRHDRWA
jgi:hypothetical protein